MTVPQGLRAVSLKTSYNTAIDDLSRDFFIPLLTQSKTYDRGVGYFTSGWLCHNATGLAQFAMNGGHIRWVTSPYLSRQDLIALSQAVELGESPKCLESLFNTVDELRKAIETETLNTLAWMVMDGLLEFRFAVPTGQLDGDFHDKFGIFSDTGGNQVSFLGSYNDTMKGFRNYESIRTFTSWNEATAEIVIDDVERFTRIWSENEPNLRIYRLPDAVRNRIIHMRSLERPYPAPQAQPIHLLKDASSNSYATSPILIPEHIELRDYQDAAILAWIANDYQGLYEMATGTGKTITALASAVRLRESTGRLALIIAVPYQHLVDQWQADTDAFGFQPILAYQQKRRWLDIFHQHVLEYNRQDRKDLAVITTHTTFIDVDFQRVLSGLTGDVLLIADEVHHLGAERSRTQLPKSVPFRLALSATPDRWFDDDGTSALRDYFGETVFQFDLEQAISQGILTKYSYFPVLVELTPEELSVYEELSTKIARLINNEETEAQKALEMLLIRRARLLNGAENKLQTLDQLMRDLGSVYHALFYCAPDQIDDVAKLLGVEHGLIIGRFTAEEPNNERQQILENFDNRVLQGLVAMKCLDEGVDVPSTKMAFILASSSNPREFIQRRGRILRRSEGKTEAIIYDFITTPPQRLSVTGSFNAEKSILERELRRFSEFANSAQNKHHALEVVWGLANRYGIHL